MDKPVSFCRPGRPGRIGSRGRRDMYSEDSIGLKRGPRLALARVPACPVHCRPVAARRDFPNCSLSQPLPTALAALNPPPLTHS